MKKINLFLLFVFISISASSQSMPSWKMTDVVHYFGKQTDSVYVINFWATFCKPCVAEIPYIQAVTKKYSKQKVALLLVSLDLPSFYPDKIASFAKQQKFISNIVWLNETDADYFCPLIDQRWSGSIPATLFINAKTGYKKFIETSLTATAFEAELVKAIGPVK